MWLALLAACFQDAARESCDAGGPSEQIAATVRKSTSRIQTCVEQSLFADAGTHGPLRVRFDVRAGRATNVWLVQNDTGDEALGRCVATAFKAFRFCPDLDVTGAEYPFDIHG